MALVFAKISSWVKDFSEMMDQYQHNIGPMPGVIWILTNIQHVLLEIIMCLLIKMCAVCFVAAERRLASLQDASLHDIRKPQQVSEDMLQEPDDDPITFIAVLVESLGTLKKMPEAVDV